VCITAGCISICCGFVSFVMCWLMDSLIVLQVRTRVEEVDSRSLFLSPAGLARFSDKVACSSDIHIHFMSCVHVTGADHVKHVMGKSVCCCLSPTITCCSLNHPHIAIIMGPPRKCWDNTSNRPQLLPSTSVLVHYSLVTLSFDAVYSELLMALLNRP
jgi:hypothetical protein